MQTSGIRLDAEIRSDRSRQAHMSEVVSVGASNWQGKDQRLQKLVFEEVATSYSSRLPEASARPRERTMPCDSSF